MPPRWPQAKVARDSCISVTRKEEGGGACYGKCAGGECSAGWWSEGRGNEQDGNVESSI